MIEITRIKIFKNGAGAYATLPISKRVETQTEVERFRIYWQEQFNQIYKNCHVELDTKEKK